MEGSCQEREQIVNRGEGCQDSKELVRYVWKDVVRCERDCQVGTEIVGLGEKWSGKGKGGQVGEKVVV
jgi:hypothetical protein